MSAYIYGWIKLQSIEGSVAPERNAVWFCSMKSSAPPISSTSVKHMVCVTGKAGANTKSSQANNRAIHRVCSHAPDPD